MKVFISADIEGVCGITANDEANPNHASVKCFQDQMTQEVAAAAEAAFGAGASEVLVKDAHWNARNIDIAKLPKRVQLVRGWSGHPYCMMDGLDDGFSVVIMIGYHARAGSNGNPLAHTMSGRMSEVRINGEPMSEFRLNYYTAAMLGVPTVFVSGDAALCREINDFNDEIKTVAAFRGMGTATVTKHPNQVIEEIRNGVGEALASNIGLKENPSEFLLELDYKQPKEAYGAGYYPGCEHVGENTVHFKSQSYLDVLTAIKFIV